MNHYLAWTSIGQTDPRFCGGAPPA